MKKTFFVLLCLLALTGCGTPQPAETGPSSPDSSSSASAPEVDPPKSSSSSSQEETPPPSSSSGSSGPSSSSGSGSSKPQSGSSAVQSSGTSAPPPASSSSASEPPETQPPAPDPYIEKLKKLVYDGFKAGPPQHKYIYPVTGSWTNTVTNYSYDTPGQAHLGWKVSWVLEGLDYAYRATGDRQFLETSIQMFDALLAVRDDNLGRVAWDGNTYPLWGSISRYNGAVYPMTDSSGNIIARLLFHCQANDQTYVAIVNVNGESFDLKVKHKTTEYTLKGVTLATLKKRVESEINWTYYGSPLPGKRVVTAEVASDPVAPPAPASYKLVDNTNVPTVIHTALVLEPMVNAYVAMRAEGYPRADEYGRQIRLMFDTLMQHHWNPAGYFKEMDNSLTHLGGGSIVPWNQQLPLVAAMATFAKAEGDQQLAATVQKACAYFMTKVTKTSTGYLWRYWEDPSKTVTYYETTNYAGIDLTSIAAIYSTGLGFTAADMNQIAKTISSRVLASSGKPATRIDGSTPSAANIPLLYKFLPFGDRVPQLFTLLKNQTMSWDEAARMLYYMTL